MVTAARVRHRHRQAPGGPRAPARRDLRDRRRRSAGAAAAEDVEARAQRGGAHVVDRRGARRRMQVDLPRTASVGGDIAAEVTVTIDFPRPPRAIEVALAPDPLLDMADDGRLWIALARAAARRRVAAACRAPARHGAARRALWLRWRGPLGLVWKQRRVAIDSERSRSCPMSARCSERGAQIFQRHALQG